MFLDCVVAHCISVDGLTRLCLGRLEHCKASSVINHDLNPGWEFIIDAHCLHRACAHLSMRHGIFSPLIQGLNALVVHNRKHLAMIGSISGCWRNSMQALVRKVGVR